MSKLTQKQEQFCREYLIDLNATQAAIRAGYSKKTAKSAANRMLTNVYFVHVQEYLSEIQKERVKRTEITADMVIKELALIAFQDSANLVDENDTLQSIHGMGSDVSRTIAEVTVRTERGKYGEDNAEITKVKTYDKKGALDSLGKHFGIFEKDNTQAKPEFKIHVTREILK